MRQMSVRQVLTMLITQRVKVPTGLIASAPLIGPDTLWKISYDAGDVVIFSHTRLKLITLVGPHRSSARIL